MDKMDSNLNYENSDMTESNFSPSIEDSVECSEQSCTKSNSPTVSSVLNPSPSISNKCVNNEQNLSLNSSSSEAVVKSSDLLQNSSLCALSIYGDSSSSAEEVSEDELEIRNNTRFESGVRSTAFTISQAVYDAIDDEVSSVSSSSSSVCSIILDGSDLTDDDDDVDIELSIKKKKATLSNKMVTAGELTIDDLPPIQDLSISVPQDQCNLLGSILNIVDKLVVVQGIMNIPALDLDTVLFLEWNKPLGKVFDVFGPVVEPLYCVRFNSSDHIKEKNISVGMPVYFVPKSNYTRYVFLAQLMRMRGSDASWEDNNEPPPECLDYSDDEQERKALKTLRRAAARNRVKKDPDAPNQRLSANERQMNKNNNQMNKANNRRSKKKRNEKNVMHTPKFVPPPSCNYTSNYSQSRSFSSSPFSNAPSPLNIKPNIKQLSSSLFSNNSCGLPHPSVTQNCSGSMSFQQQFNNDSKIQFSPQQFNTLATIPNNISIGDMSVPPPMVHPVQSLAHSSGQNEIPVSHQMPHNSFFQRTPPPNFTPVTPPPCPSRLPLGNSFPFPPPSAISFPPPSTIPFPPPPAADRLSLPHSLSASNSQTQPPSLFASNSQTQPHSLFASNSQTQPHPLFASNSQIQPRSLFASNRTQPHSLSASNSQTQPPSLFASNSQTQPHSLFVTNRQTQPPSLSVCNSQTQLHSLSASNSQTQPPSLFASNSQTQPHSLFGSNSQTQGITHPPPSAASVNEALMHIFQASFQLSNHSFQNGAL